MTEQVHTSSDVEAMMWAGTSCVTCGVRMPDVAERRSATSSAQIRRDRTSAVTGVLSGFLGFRSVFYPTNPFCSTHILPFVNWKSVIFNNISVIIKTAIIIIVRILVVIWQNLHIIGFSYIHSLASSCNIIRIQTIDIIFF